MTNSSNNNTNLPVENTLIEYNEKKKIQTYKNNTNENQETKFSITQIKEKMDILETHKKCFFVISDEIKDEEDEVSIKLKRDILVSKLLWDQTMITEKKLENTFDESLLTATFLTLSNESRKALMENYSQTSTEYFNFHGLIGYEKLDEENLNLKNFNPVSNESILNICDKFLKLEDLNGFLDPNMIFAERKIELANDSFKTKSISPNLEKYVLDKRNTDPNIEMHSDKPLYLTDKIIEGDEDFDEENLNFFKEFIKNNQNHPIKDKVEKILTIFNTDKISNKKMRITNKAKNEILRSLKLEYVTKLEELTKLEEEKRKENEMRERLKKEVREQILKEEEEKKIEERIKKELDNQMPIWIKKGYDKKKILSCRKELIKNITEQIKIQNQKQTEENLQKEKINTEVSQVPITTNDLQLKTENILDRASSNEKRMKIEKNEKNEKSGKNQKNINFEIIPTIENIPTEKEKNIPNALKIRKSSITTEKTEKNEMKNKYHSNVSTDKERTFPEKEKIINPFVENMENQAKLNLNKNKNKFYTEETNMSNDANDKVIYTNKGWGIVDYKKVGIKLSQNVGKKSNENQNSTTKNNRYEKVNDNSNVSNLMKKYKNTKKIIDLGNQKIIYPNRSKKRITEDRSNDNSSYMRNNGEKSKDFWIGNRFSESDEFAEWNEI